MLRAHVLHDDGRVETDAALAIATSPPADATVWVDLVAPTDEEVALLTAQWHFHPLAVEDVVNGQKRSKYERYPDHSFVVSQALDRTTDDLLDTVPVSVFLRPHLVVTVRPKHVAAVEAVFDTLATFPERVGSHAERIVHALVDAIIDEYTTAVYQLEERVDALEEQASSHHQAGLMDDLVWVRRDLLTLRRLTLPQAELVRRFAEADGAEPGAAGPQIYFRDVLDHLVTIQEQTALLLDVVNGALQVHSNAVNERLNQVMKYMAIVSTLMLPMTVISGVFGMNFDVIPIQHHTQGFWMAVGMMVASAALLLGVFRARQWF